MSAELLQDNEDIDFVRGRANQLVPPKGETTICDCINNGLIANLYLRGPKPEEITAFPVGRPRWPCMNTGVSWCCSWILAGSL